MRTTAKRNPIVLVTDVTWSTEATYDAWRFFLRLLTFSALISTALPTGFCQASATPLPRFEVVSVKANPDPVGLSSDVQERTMSGSVNRVTMPYVSMMKLLTLAFGVQAHEISGPSWLGEKMYAIAAIAPPHTPKEQKRLMLQSLLSERFGLTYHRESPIRPAYVLTVAHGGAQLQSGIPDNDPDNMGQIREGVPPGVSSARTFFGIYRLSSVQGTTRYEFLGTTMKALAEYLTLLVNRGGADRPVVDMTGLSGKYQVVVEVKSGEGGHRSVAPPQDEPGDAPASAAVYDPAPDSIKMSLEKRGILMVRRDAPVEIIVIDSINKTPTEN